MAKININIIERIITGCATSEEESVLHAWLEYHQANRDAYFRMKNIWDSCRIKGYSQNDIRREWELLAKRINTIEIKPQSEVRRTRAIRQWMRYAAVFAVAAGLTWTLVWLKQSPQPPQLIQQPVTYQQFTVPNGQHTQVTLSDGSTLWLNAGTTLKFPSDFGVHSRQVILNGEASFRVTPSNIPFTVMADEVEITVLGTHFNVRNYSTDNYVETTLLEGSVKLQTPRNELTMKHHEMVTYWKNQQTADIKQIPDAADKFAWNNNRLMINGERLEDIARTLERKYDVHITIADDELKDYRYTGKFVYNEDVKQVLNVISATTSMQYQVDGKKIIISKRETKKGGSMSRSTR